MRLREYRLLKISQRIQPLQRAIFKQKVFAKNQQTQLPCACFLT